MKKLMMTENMTNMRSGLESMVPGGTGPDRLRDKTTMSFRINLGQLLRPLDSQADGTPFQIPATYHGWNDTSDAQEVLL